jgi:ABC-type Fe3+-hydroxamate transport system substrate-binding protein
LLDPLNHIVHLPAPAKRIVSLVPSQTELLFDLGLDVEIVGITKFCTHPEEKVRNKPVVGGTKNFRFDLIDQLQPDLIIGNREENDQEGVARLREKYPIWMSDVVTLDDALRMIRSVGHLTGRSSESSQLASRVRLAFQELVMDVSRLVTPRSVAYLIWRKPYMAAASGTFIDSMLAHCGLDNVFSSWSRYPEISAEQLRAATPQFIFLPSEPYPFQNKHLPELQTICPQAKLMFVRGDMFSWYGSRLLEAVPYFRQLIEVISTCRANLPRK